MRLAFYLKYNDENNKLHCMTVYFWIYARMLELIQVAYTIQNELMLLRSNYIIQEKILLYLFK